MSGALWATVLVVLPLLGAVFTFISGRRSVPLLPLLTLTGILGGVVGLGLHVWQWGPQRYAISGWDAPLGIEWYADGLSVFMLFLSAIVGSFVTLYAINYFDVYGRRPQLPVPENTPTLDKSKTKEELPQGQFLFWPLWLLLWSGLNALFLAADLFNVYLALEMLTVATIALIILDGSLTALQAALRYLLVTVCASLMYVLGIALLYSAFGTLNMAWLSQVIDAGPSTWVAMTLIILGLLVKTALFPLHYWLPPAHANAPIPVSALLSTLIVTGAFYLLLRMCFEVFPNQLLPSLGQLLGWLGASAILWGSLQTLRQRHLKALIAYSTVAQIGFLFLLFPLASGITDNWSAMAWYGGIYQALAHGFAKTAMFMAAGNIVWRWHADRLEDLRGLGQNQPLTLFALALGGINVIGMPPSGGFIAKWLLLNAALESGQWWWALIMIVGNLLAAIFIFRVLTYALEAHNSETVTTPVEMLPLSMELAPLILALLALALGVITLPPFAFLAVGSPFVSLAGVVP